MWHGCTTETIKALLEARWDPNPPLLGAGAAPLHQSIFYSRGQISPVETVRLLLEWRADPNTPATASGALAAEAEAALKEESLKGKQSSSCEMT